jgi:peroxiredoxin
MDAWGKAQGTAGKVRMIADGNAEFAKALGLDFDGAGIGFGTRSQRFALIAQDGVVKHLAVEQPMKFEVSSAEKILEKL